MTVDPDRIAREAARQFCKGSLISLARLGKGNINDTYLAKFGSEAPETHLVLQRINSKVFRDPRLIAANMRVVGQHLDGAAARGEESFSYPRLLPDHSGNVLWVDGDGGCWRAAEFVDWAETFPVVRDAGHAREIGRVLGRFHVLTARVDTADLHDTLPGFHNCPRYLAEFDLSAKAAAERGSDRLGSEGTAAMMRFVEARRARAGLLEQATLDGRCTRRVMHGDPKADNVLINTRSGRGVGLIDFDTVKPGLWQYDFGDAARSVANPAGEDAPPETVRCELPLFSAFAAGYLGETARILPESELALLGASAWLLTFELGVRFLGDYLAGDVYFRVADGDRNRRRAMVQLRLCADIERRQSEIDDMIAEAAAKSRRHAQ